MEKVKDGVYIPTLLTFITSIILTSIIPAFKNWGVYIILSIMGLFCIQFIIRAFVKGVDCE